MALWTLGWNGSWEKLLKMEFLLKKTSFTFDSFNIKHFQVNKDGCSQLVRMYKLTQMYKLLYLKGNFEYEVNGRKTPGGPEPGFMVLPRSWESSVLRLEPDISLEKWFAIQWPSKGCFSWRNLVRFWLWEQRRIVEMQVDKQKANGHIQTLLWKCSY